MRKLKCKARQYLSFSCNCVSHMTNLYMNFKLSKDVEKNPGPTQYNTDHHEVIIRPLMQNQDTSAGTGKLCILGHLGLVFIWSCFVSCLLFLLFYVSLRNLCSGTCRKIPKSQLNNAVDLSYFL